MPITSVRTRPSLVLGLVLVAVVVLFGAIALVADLTRSTTGVATSFTPVVGHWKGIAPDSLKGAQDRVVAVHPVLWSQVAGRILLLPTWLVLGGLGITLGYLGRRQRRANIFINN